MTTYLRRAEDRRKALLEDLPDTKFEFESQKFSDIPREKRPPINNYLQNHGFGAQAVKKYDTLIEEAAKRQGVNPDIVRAVIYTEASRGGEYGYPGEAVGRTIRSLLKLKQDVIAHTILPGNIDSGWQKLIPGSDVHNPRDNIELTAKLLAGIAKRLDDPSVENIYSLYNGLSHDRTYVNKQIKSTPYYAKRAFEDKAWEKDEWSPPDVADEPESGPAIPGKQVDPAGSRASDDRLGPSPPEIGRAAMPQSPLLRELARRKAAASGAQPPPDVALPDHLFPRGPGEPSNPADIFATGDAPDPVRGPVRILRSRRADQPASTGEVPAPAGAAPNQLPLMNRSPLFQGNSASTGNAIAPISPYQQFGPAPQSTNSLGLFSGDAMPDYPFELPAFGDSTLSLEDWARLRMRRSPSDPAR